MRRVSYVLLLCMLAVSCETKSPTKPAVTDADVELYDQQVSNYGTSIGWQGRILNRSQYLVKVGVKLELTAPPTDSTFFSFSEKLIDVSGKTSTFFVYSESNSEVPYPTLPATWNWRMKARAVSF